MKSGPPPPFQLPPRYQYTGKSLSGGQGTVFVCEDAYLKRKVAIKSLHNIDDTEALIKEVHARGKVQSKHVVEIYECWYEDDEPYALVLEYIPGNTLQDQKTHPASLDAKLKMLYQLACGISDLHAGAIIHRDIKPDNMKLDKDGVLKIFDLGLSNLDADNANTVGAAGTIVYRAPELYKTPPIKVERSADIYALGVTAWFFLAGNIPSPLTEVPPQNSKEVDALSKHVSDLGRIGRTLDRCLHVDPSKRPAATAVRDALCRRLIFGRHRAILTYAGQTHEISKPGTTTRVKFGEHDQIAITYDGMDFVVSACDGDVFANNKPIAKGTKLPDSCVMTFGEGALGTRREFVSFNVSNPEIVL